MEEQISSLTSNNKYIIGEKIDCMDTCNKWLDARIIDLKDNDENEVPKVKVTYTDFGDQYDEWIQADSDRIIK